MNISLVMGVYNNLEYTKKAYKNIRLTYPDTPLIISSGGSTDGTKEWLESLDDDFLTFFHDDDRLSLSDTYNAGIKLVDTDKLVLIHNDMVLGKYFLKNIDKMLQEDIVLNYTLVEPPIFTNHHKPGKIIMDFGTDFETFKSEEFYTFETDNLENTRIELGGSFFIAGYKKMFENVGYFDGLSFFPAFCEDDDFILRAKLKGYKLFAIYNAMVYHFVSKTSRYSEEFASNKGEYELNSNINFIRKWGLATRIFELLRFWEEDSFEYKTFSMGFTSENKNDIDKLEPYFDKIKTKIQVKEMFKKKQDKTNFNLTSKLTFVDQVDVMVIQEGELTNEDYETISKLRLSIPHYEPGEYKTGNFTILINNKV